MSQFMPDNTFHYLYEERDLSVRAGVEIGYPIRVFTLQGLGLDQDAFVNDLAPTFHTLAWDYYDAKRDQTQFLIARHPDQKERLERFMSAYYAGRSDLAEVADLIQGLTEADKTAFEQIAPYRRRSISRFALTRIDATWSVEQQTVEAFTQAAGAENDYRELKRVFEPTSEYVLNHPEFGKLLVCVAEMVRSVRSGVRNLKLTCHQMALVAKPKRQVTNAPEGMHQDGADYIVSAIVMERRGVIGGESRVYAGDKKTCYLAHMLQVGEGLFQADSSSPLWHDVTPVTLDRYSGFTEGVRTIFGFDINVIE